jgi:antitoxin VapB
MDEPLKAKIFRNGGSQAVRLPKACRFPEEQDEVLVKKVGRRVILEPADRWPEEFLASLGAWDEEIERPVSRAVAETRDPFE